MGTENTKYSTWRWPEKRIASQTICFHVFRSRRKYTNRLWEWPKRFSVVGHEISLGWWVSWCWVNEGISLRKQDIPAGRLCGSRCRERVQPMLPLTGSILMGLFPSGVKTRTVRTEPLPTTRNGEKRKSTRKSSAWEFIVLSPTLPFSVLSVESGGAWEGPISNSGCSHHVSPSCLF